MSDQPTTSRPTDLHAWDEAFRRVESYFRALGIESRVRLNTLVTEVITAGQQSALEREGIEPVTLAMEKAHEKVGTWFQQILGPANSGDERFLARGRLNLFMAEVPSRWPHCFLSEDPPPGELVAAMSAASVQSGPEVRFSNMAPQPIEFALTPAATVARQVRIRGPVLRTAALWTLIIGVLGVTWAASHH